MKFNIGGKEVEIKFGYKFVREADKIDSKSFDGHETNTGILKLANDLALGSPEAIFQLIKFGATETVTDKQIEDFLDDLEDYDETYVELAKKFSESNQVMTRVASVFRAVKTVNSELGEMQRIYEQVQKNKENKVTEKQ